MNRLLSGHCSGLTSSLVCVPLACDLMRLVPKREQIHLSILPLLQMMVFSAAGNDRYHQSPVFPRWTASHAGGTCCMDGYGSCQSFLSLYRAKESRPHFMPLCLRRAESLLRRAGLEPGDPIIFTVFTNHKIQVCCLAQCPTRQDA